MTAIASGMQTTKDLDTATRVFTVSRAVVQVDRQFHPDRERFFVKEASEGQAAAACKGEPAAD